MNRARKFLIGLVVAFFGVLAVLAYSQFMRPPTVINYRLTVEAGTPDGPKIGSGIIQVAYSSQCCVPGFGRRGEIRVTGEAVPLELGQGKVLFVTLTSGASGRNSSPGTLDGSLDAGSIPVHAFGSDWKEMMHVAGPVDIALRSLPDLVTFSDIADPRTVELVQPEALPAKFGTGYVLTKATVEITDAPPTKRIEGILRWLNSLDQYQSDPNNAFTGTARIARKQFIQG